MFRVHMSRLLVVRAVGLGKYATNR